MLTTRSVVTTTTIQPQMTPQYYAAAPPAPRVSATPPAPQLNVSLNSYLGNSWQQTKRHQQVQRDRVGNTN